MNAAMKLSLSSQHYRVVLVQLDKSYSRDIIHALEKTGSTLDACHDSLEDLSLNQPDGGTDVIIVTAMNFSAIDLKLLERIQKGFNHPLVIITNSARADTINQAVNLGVHAFVVGDFQPARLPSILTVAIARHKQHSALLNELKQTRSKLEERKLIERAKGILMENRQLTEDEAFKRIRKMAMDKGQTLSQVARNIIDVFQNF